jgi:hypothetical protein
MSLAARGGVKASITVKAIGFNSRMDFDLRPSAENKIKHYVWVRGRNEVTVPAGGLKPTFERLHRPPLKTVGTPSGAFARRSAPSLPDAQVSRGRLC